MVRKYLRDFYVTGVPVTVVFFDGPHRLFFPCMEYQLLRKAIIEDLRNIDPSTR